MTNSNKPEYFIGVMSGTSLDAVDAILMTDNNNYIDQFSIDIPSTLKQRLLSLNFPQNNEIHISKICEYELTLLYASACQALLDHNKIESSAVIAIGAHGQTIRHNPTGETPYTIQLLNGALLSQTMAITVICDFRSKDIALGGQGAPLAPLFHRFFLNHKKENIAVINIGGISNISILTQKKTKGFDCGPGNCLLDEWMNKKQNKPYDKNGAFADQGSVSTKLLNRFLKDPYFNQTGTKSSSREYFNLSFIDKYLSDDLSIKDEDVMRTLVMLTAKVIANSIPAEINIAILCGGGCYNKRLVDDIKSLSHASIYISDDYGINAQAVEGLGFAWLAKMCIEKTYLSTESVTGAKKPHIPGCIYTY